MNLTADNYFSPEAQRETDNIFSEYKGIKSGDIFDRLVTISVEKTKGFGVWKCKCDCGNIVYVPAVNLRNGRKRSCGCLRKEMTRELGKRHTHGMAHTRLYNTWHSMKTRCNPNAKTNSKIYSDRGIKVCSEWQNFEPFMKWALENGYSDNLTIDRIDVNGDYCPENCRWITMSEQQLNKRTNVKIEHNGKTQTISEWSKETGLSFAVIHWRYKQGKTGDDLFKPLFKSKTLNYKGEEKTVKEVSELYGVHIGTVYNLMYKYKNDQDVFDALERKVKKRGLKCK